MAAASARRADKGLGRRAAPLVSAPASAPCSAPPRGRLKAQGNGMEKTTRSSSPGPRIRAGAKTMTSHDPEIEQLRATVNSRPAGTPAAHGGLIENKARLTALNIAGKARS